MTLFQEINCARCGGKTNLITRRKLSDGACVCGKCLSRIPGPIAENVRDLDTKDFEELHHYIYRENKKLGEQFRETHRYKNIHIDTRNNLYYLDTMSPRVYLKLEYLSEFHLEFVADELKEGFLRDTVTGKVYLKMKSSFPVFYVDRVIAEGVKAGADVKDGLFRKKVTYKNPADLEKFLGFFHSAWTDAREELYTRLSWELEESKYQEQWEDQ